VVRLGGPKNHCGLDSSALDFIRSECPRARRERVRRGDASCAQSERTAPGQPGNRPNMLQRHDRPALPYAVQAPSGIQGESNAGRAWQYRTLFSIWSKTWRPIGGSRDFTFPKCSLLPSWRSRMRRGSSFAELREPCPRHKTSPGRHRRSSRRCERKNIPPKRRSPWDARLALAARVVPRIKACFLLAPPIKVSPQRRQGLVGFDCHRSWPGGAWRRF